METWNSIFSFFMWAFFAIGSGVVEAFFFHVADYKRLSHANTVYGDVHGYLNIVRIFVFLGMVPFAMSIPCIMVFPFIHDGAYYSFRNVMDRNIYPDRWRTNMSSDTTAMISLNIKTRSFLFAFGLAIMISQWISINL
jgi:hypothetical protein